MTICKVLKTAEVGDVTITAYENWEKFSAVPHYSISLSKDSIGFTEVKTAKTTWKRKFAELAREYA